MPREERDARSLLETQVDARLLVVSVSIGRSE